MNAERLARLFRERAALDLEIAEAFAEQEPKRQRQRPRAALPDERPSDQAIEKVRTSLRRNGVPA